MVRTCDNKKSIIYPFLCVRRLGKKPPKYLSVEIKRQAEMCKTCLRDYGSVDDDDTSKSDN